tara:strand:+ start:16264 stop:17406 length:1143 start_codon:yes stop_codon:yes gene_type:complete
MRLALVIYRYFPFGGLQRDFSAILEALRARGHVCRVYCTQWSGPVPAQVDLRCLPARGITNHRREAHFQARVRADLLRDPVQGVIGFLKMPGLDVYFAGDGCYLARVADRPGWWQRHSARFRHYAGAERAVFDPASDTHVFCIARAQRAAYNLSYRTPEERLHLLPPGICADRVAPPHPARERAALRTALAFREGELALLFLASAFATKGLDRAIIALANTLAEQPSVRARLLVVGSGKPRRYRRLAARLGIARSVEFLGGRDDVVALMQAADLLVHPARSDAGAAVLLEALALGLPVVATAACGHAPHIVSAHAGFVLEEPFQQAALNRALLRMLDGVFRADCRENARRYSQRLDLYSMPGVAAQWIEQLLSREHAADA